MVLRSDNRKAKKILQWSPKYSNNEGIDAALKKTIEWYLNPKNLNNINAREYVL